MLINVSQPEECRIAIVEDGLLEELYIERSSQDNYVGNIYKGKIVNLEPSIQAAFVDFGVGRNGFLHISDVEPQYYRQGGYDPDKPIELNGFQKSDRKTDADHRKENDGPTNGERPGGNSGDQRNGPSRTSGRRMRPGLRPRIKPPIQEIFRQYCCPQNEILSWVIHMQRGIIPLIWETRAKCRLANGGRSN